MPYSKYILILFGIVIASIGGVIAIKCWDCNSLNNKKWEDPLDQSEFEMADCSQKFMARYPNKPGALCRKIIQKVNDEYRYIRGCGYIGEDGHDARPGEDLPSECMKRAGTFSVLVQYCSCNGKDGCNHAGHVIVSYISVMIPVILVIGKLL